MNYEQNKFILEFKFGREKKNKKNKLKLILIRFWAETSNARVQENYSS